MQNQFSIRRFGLLFKKHTAEQYKYYLMALVVLTGLLFLILLSFCSISLGIARPPLPIREQEAMFVITLMLSGSIYTSTIFSDLGNRKKAASELMLPASLLEKFLIKWIYSYLFYQLIFVGVFYLALYFVGVWYEHKHGIRFVYLDPMALFSSFRNVNALWFMYAFLHAIMLWGSITFKKLQFVKTAIACIPAIILLAFFNYVTLGFLLGEFGHITTYFPFSNVLIEYGPEDWYNLIPGVGWGWYIYLVLGTMAGFFWVISYFKLKEKQI